MATYSVLCVGAVVLYSHGTAYLFNDMGTGAPPRTVWQRILSCVSLFQNCEILDRSMVLDNQRLRLGPKRVGIFTIDSFTFFGIEKENDSMLFFELVEFGFAMVWRSVWWLAG